MGLLDYHAKAWSWKGKDVGACVKGRVVKDAEEIQRRDYDTNELLFWKTEGSGTTTTDTGRPAMQLVVTVDTGNPDQNDPDDDGLRAIYLTGDGLAKTRQVCRKLRVREIKENGFFSITLVERKDTGDKKKAPQNVHDVEYEPPAVAADDAQPATRETGAQAVRRVGSDSAHHAGMKSAGRSAQGDEDPPF